MRRLGKVLAAMAGAGLILLLAISPTQLGFTTAGGANLCLADILLLPVAACWFFAALCHRRLPQIIALPGAADALTGASLWRLWPQLALALLAALSIGAASDRGDALREAVQITLYLVVASFLFYDFLKTGFQAPAATAQTASDERQMRARRTAFLLAALLLPLIVNLAAAIRQYLDSGCADLHVRGLFGNRNVLGGFLALAIPLLFGLAEGAGRLRLWLPAALVITAAFALNLSGAAYGAIALTLLLLAKRRGPLLFAGLALVLLLWQCLVLPRLPRENDLAHFRSVALYNDEGMPERRYPEWQAALSLMLTNPWRGVGGGNYQRQVGRYYDVVPNPTGPAEPDIQNLYLVFGANFGFPGLLALLAVIGGAWLTAAGAADRSREARTAGLAAGVAGSLAAFAITALWHPLIVRGIGLPLAAVLALAYALGDLAAGAVPPQNPEV